MTELGAGVHDVTVQATDQAGNVTSETWRVNNGPASGAVPTHDAEGNLLTDGFYTCTWDGWNLVAELESATEAGPPVMKRGYVWGLDVADSLTTSGGVGALMFEREHGPTGTLVATWTPLYDGNGNVLALMNAQSSSIGARYEYDAFGRVLRATGPKAEWNPIRFSTKYEDGESALLYYGYRYYPPELGRWPSRDPIGENGGTNLYGMVGNDAVNRVDYLGLDWPTLNGSPLGHLAPYLWPGLVDLWPGLVDPPKMFPDSVWEAVEKSEEFQNYLKNLERIAKNKAELLKVKTERGYGDKFHIHAQNSPGMNPLQQLHAGVIAGGVDVTISAHDITIDCDLVSNLRRKCYCNAKADLPVALFNNYGFGGYTGNPSGNWGNTALKWLFAIPSLGQAKDYQISDFRKIQWEYEFSPEGL